MLATCAISSKQGLKLKDRPDTAPTPSHHTCPTGHRCPPSPRSGCASSRPSPPFNSERSGHCRGAQPPGLITRGRQPNWMAAALVQRFPNYVNLAVQAALTSAPAPPQSLALWWHHTLLSKSATVRTSPILASPLLRDPFPRQAPRDTTQERPSGNVARRAPIQMPPRRRRSRTEVGDGVGSLAALPVFDQDRGVARDSPSLRPLELCALLDVPAADGENTKSVKMRGRLRLVHS